MFNDINIETTTLCNRRCAYCPNSIFERSLKQNTKLLPDDLFKKIVNELRAIQFTGRISPHFYGEPLLDSRLTDLMRYAHQILPKAKLVIYTNADFLDKDILNDLHDAGVRLYVITFHGGDKERYINKKRIRELFNSARESKKCIKIKTLDISNDTSLYTRGGLVEVSNVSMEVSCQRASNPLVIDCQGNVLLCCNDYLGTVSFGNLGNETLMDIWNKNSFKKIRKELRNRTYNLDICKKCASGSTGWSGENLPPR